MRFKVGDLVVIDRAVAKNHMNHGGYGKYLLKMGIVVSVRIHPSNKSEAITVKFPCYEEPEEWLGSDFEWIGTNK